MFIVFKQKNLDSSGCVIGSPPKRYILSFRHLSFSVFSSSLSSLARCVRNEWRYARGVGFGREKRMQRKECLENLLVACKFYISVKQCSLPRINFV